MDSKETPTRLLSPLVPGTSGWSTRILVLCIVLPILATLAVVGRFIAKGKARARFRLDDALIIVALIIHYGQIVCGLVTVTLGGTGRDSGTLDPETHLTAGKVLVAVQYMWVASLAFAKCSVCVMLLGIFGHYRRFRLGMYGTLVLIIGWTVMNFLTAVLSCNPVSLNWDKSVIGSCDDIEVSFIINAILDVLADLILAMAPIPYIWHLKQTNRVKVALTLLFALTLFDMVLGLLRGWAIGQGSRAAGDWTSLSLAWFFGVMEPGVAIVIACATLMRPLLDAIAPREWLTNAIRPISKGHRRKSSAKGDSGDATMHIIAPTCHQIVDSALKSSLHHAPTITVTVVKEDSNESEMIQEFLLSYPDKTLIQTKPL